MQDDVTNGEHSDGVTAALLRTANMQLRAQLATVLKEARVNEEKMRRFDQLERRVIGATSLAAVINTLLVDYRALFELDAVTLALVDPQYEVLHILGSPAAAGGTEETLLFLDDDRPLRTIYRQNSKPVLASTGDAPALLFVDGASQLKSVALLPLVHLGRFMGSLNLGSSNPARFKEADGTDFLERLAALVAVCLNNALATERLKLAGLTDTLTGVHNRRYFDSRCLEEVAAARRNGAPLVCVFLDVDRFKNLNDTLGHQAGDKVLSYVAKLIKLQLRGSDVVARYGGEEFVVLLPATPYAHGMDTAERIRRIVEGQSVPLAANEFTRVTISAGVAIMHRPPKSSDVSALAADLIARADKAMYEAKQAGRNRVVFSDSR